MVPRAPQTSVRIEGARLRESQRAHGGPHAVPGNDCPAVNPAYIHVRRRSRRPTRRRSGGLLRRSGQPATFQSRWHPSQRQLRNGPSAEMTRTAWTPVLDPQVGQRTPSFISVTTKDQASRSHVIAGANRKCRKCWVRFCAWLGVSTQETTRYLEHVENALPLRCVR